MAEKIKDVGLKPILEKLNSHFLDYIAKHGIVPNQAGFINCLHPNHPDRNPSMTVGGREGFKNEVGYCFSCGTSCNITHAVHYLENKPMGGVEFYQDTLPYLCKMFDIPYTPIEISDDQKREFQKRRAYTDAVSIINMMAFKKGKVDIEHPAIKHLIDRGITESTIRKFKIGCISSHKNYMDEMKAMGWTDRSYLEGADLANKKLFNNTGIIIPIFDSRSRPVGFVTRKTNMPANAKGQEKYCNSLNSDIYHKSEILFNFNNYKKDEGSLYIVEGYLDAVYLTQVGLKNVAAIGATVITESHIKLLMDYNVKNINLCLDADEGGTNGIKIAIERLAPYKYFKLRIMELPEGQDPDTFVRENGLKAFTDLAKTEASLSAFAWTLKHTTFEDDPMEIAKRAVPTIAAEESNLTRLQMIRELSRLTSIPEIEIKKDVDSLVNKDSNIFLEELKNINNFVQVQLTKRNIKDTKNILQDSVIRITNLERLYNNTVDNRNEYRDRVTSLRDKIDGGDLKYGLRTAKYKRFEKMFDGTPFNTCLTLVGGRPSAGKCLAPGTKVWMYDGSLKNVEDIQLGDLLMGDDSKPRTVLGTTSGYDNMWKVSQANAMTYVVNNPHVLSLKRRNNLNKKGGAVTDIPLNKFIKKSKKFQNNFKGYKTSISFNQQDTLIDPYFLGLWLGNGDSNNAQIYTTDKEVIDYIYSYANSLSLIVTANKNDTCTSYSIVRNDNFNSRDFSLQKLLWVENLLGNKHVPKQYLINSDNVRLSLLAGIIDSNGLFFNHRGYYEITLKDLHLIKQVKQVADTLGFRTNLTKKETECKNTGSSIIVHQLIISGNVWRIPTKIERKRAYAREKRDWTTSRISIHSNGHGPYYGFELDGNGRFLLEDCTVTHNTTWLTGYGIDLIESNDDSALFYMSIDDTTELMTLKMLAMRTGLSTSKIKRYTDLTKEEKSLIDEAWEWHNKISERLIIADTTSGNSIEALEAHIEWFIKNFKDSKRIFFLDNFHKLSTHGFGRASKTEAISHMSERIKTMTQLNDLHIFMTVELRKLEGTNSWPSLTDLKDSVQLEYDADVIILVHNDFQANENSFLVYPGVGADGEKMTMPYIVNHVCKNKVTGIQGKLGYELNSHNLRINEVPSGTITAQISKSKNRNNIYKFQ